jgi:hypothetical protein
MTHDERVFQYAVALSLKYPPGSTQADPLECMKAAEKWVGKYEEIFHARKMSEASKKDAPAPAPEAPVEQKVTRKPTRRVLSN